MEVKANTNRARSMNQLIKSDSYEDIKHGIKLTTGNIGIDNNIVTFPIFLYISFEKVHGSAGYIQIGEQAVLIRNMN